MVVLWAGKPADLFLYAVPVFENYPSIWSLPKHADTCVSGHELVWKWAFRAGFHKNAGFRAKFRVYKFGHRCMYPKCGNLCGQRVRKRFIASWGLRMSHICPCTPCPSPPGYMSKVESRHFAHLCILHSLPWTGCCESCRVHLNWNIRLHAYSQARLKSCWTLVQNTEFRLESCHGWPPLVISITSC